MYSFSYSEPVCCSMSSSNCCFLTCIQVSQEVGQVVWYSHLLQNFPPFIVIHTVKGFGIIVHKAEIDVFLELSCFFNDPVDVGNLISGSSAFSKTCQMFPSRGKKGQSICSKTYTFTPIDRYETGSSQNLNKLPKVLVLQCGQQGFKSPSSLSNSTCSSFQLTALEAWAPLPSPWSAHTLTDPC